MDIRKLQRAIVDGLEDVKAQEIVVFNTEHLSPLFERVIIASGTSNRQTKALAAGVRDAVRSAGFPVLATEGADNGEWIIVDCGAAVAHIMQPAIRDYYRLEEIWGGKPVKMKLGEGHKGLVKASEPDDEDDEPAMAPDRKAAAKKGAAAKRPPAKKAAVARPVAATKRVAQTPAERSTSTRPAAKKAAAAEVEARKVVARKTAAQTAAKKADAAKVAAATNPARNPAARKTAARTTIAGKTAGRKVAAAPVPAVRTIVVKPVARKTAADKAAAPRAARPAGRKTVVATASPPPPARPPRGAADHRGPRCAWCWPRWGSGRRPGLIPLTTTSPSAFRPNFGWN